MSCTLSKLLPSSTQSGPSEGMEAQAHLSDIFSGREWRSWRVPCRTAIWPRWVDPSWLLQLCHKMLTERGRQRGRTFQLSHTLQNYDKATTTTRVRTQSQTYSLYFRTAYLFQGSRVSLISRLPCTRAVMARLPGLSPQPEGFPPNDGHRKKGGTQ